MFTLNLNFETISTILLCLYNFSDLYANDTCAPSWDCVCVGYGLSTGGICPMGYYCPQGSSAPVACDSGQYCETPGLPSPTGLYLYYLLLSIHFKLPGTSIIFKLLM